MNDLLKKSDLEQAELGFLHAELRIGLSLVEFALRAKRQDTIKRNSANGRKAYDTVLRFMPGVKLTATEENEIKTKLAEIKAKLKLLDENVQSIAPRRRERKPNLSNSHSLDS